MKTINGSCMCGGVQYEARGELRDVIGCHCVECRKSSGHYTAATSVSPDNLSLLSENGLSWYRASALAQRGFCRHCGSTLFWKPESGDRISIFAGSIDGDPGLQLTSHIYMAEKGHYYEVNDGEEAHATTGAKLTLDNR